MIPDMTANSPSWLIRVHIQPIHYGNTERIILSTPKLKFIVELG